MKRSVLVALALVAAMVPVSIGAQSSTNVQSFTAAGTDASPTFTGGYNTCSLQVSGTWSGFTVVPKGSSDNGLTYPTTLTTIGGGSITSNGNYSGSIAGLALTNLEYVVSGTSPTGTINVTKTCNAQLSSVSVTGVPTAGPTAAPGPTDGNGVPYSHPTGVPTFAPAPTPYPTNADGGAPAHLTNGTPIPIVTASPGGLPAHQPILYGNGATYVDSAIDEITYAAVSTATTTQVIAGVSGQYTFIAGLALYSTGTNASSFAYFEWGTGATCGTGTKNITQFVAIGTANGSLTQVLLPLSRPIVVPQAYNVCVVTVGSTIAIDAQAYYTQHG